MYSTKIYFEMQKMFCHFSRFKSLNPFLIQSCWFIDTYIYIYSCSYSFQWLQLICLVTSRLVYFHICNNLHQYLSSVAIFKSALISIQYIWPFQKLDCQWTKKCSDMFWNILNIDVFKRRGQYFGSLFPLHGYGFSMFLCRYHFFFV